MNEEQRLFHEANLEKLQLERDILAAKLASMKLQQEQAEQQTLSKGVQSSKSEV